MAIIEEYCYGLPAPSGGEDEIDCMISIDIAGFNQETACGRNNTHRLPPGCRELNLNPIVGAARAVWPSLNAGEIWTKIPVEIGDCKWQAVSRRSSKGSLNINLRRRAAANEAKEQP